MIMHSTIKHSTLRRTLLASAIVLLLSTVLVGLSALAPRVTAQSQLASIIVELRGDPVLVAKAKAQAAGRTFDENASRQQVIAEQQQFLNRLTLLGVPYVITSVTAPNGPFTANIQFRYNYTFNGIALQVPEQTLPLFGTIQDVLTVHPNRTLHLNLDHALDYIRAPQLYGNPPRLTQFDTLNTGGLEGDGVIVAVIDTGVDWSHEMFGGDPTPPQFGAAPAVAATGPNRKVIYYLNLNAAAGPDDFGHGTHVAADIAGYRGFAPGEDMIPGTSDDVPIHGVAPQAKIMAYKIFDATGSTTSASVLFAIEDSVQPRTITGQPKPVAHVVNMSFGDSAGTADSPESIAADNLAFAGTIAVASAGNSGPGDQTAGIGTVGSPAAARRVIAVGANNDPGIVPIDMVLDRLFDTGRPGDATDVLQPASINRSTTGAVDATGMTPQPGERTNIRVYLAGGSPAIGNALGQYYTFCGTVTSAADVPDAVAGRIAIARPSGAFGVVANSIAAKGAIAVMLIRPDAAKITVGHSTVPVWSIPESDARYLLDLLSSADQVGVDPAKGVLSDFPIRVRVPAFSPAMATFSSRGPIQGYGQVKPDVTAPGVAILSATAAYGGIEVVVVPAVPPGVGFAVMFNPTRYVSASGTSFSGPITAGVAALIRQKHPDWKPSMVRAALVNSATNLLGVDGAPVEDGTQSINDQGGGLVNAQAAANVKALMGVGQPAPNGQPQGRTYGIFDQVSAGSPDFTPSYSFGAVPIANVIGTATLSQTVKIYDVTNGNGAGTYQLAVAPVANVDQSGFRVSFTDASGNPISSVAVPAAGAASFKVKTEVNGQSVTANPTQAQWYVTATRTDGGQRLRMPFYYRAVTPTIAMSAPTLTPAAGNEVSGNPPIDIDGSYSLPYSFPGSPAPAKFRIEEQKNNGSYVVLGDVPASQNNFAVSNQGNGSYNYRVAGLFAVQYGLLQGPYGATQSLVVDRRLESDVSAMIQTAVSNVSFGAAVFEFDQTLKNTSSGTTILPPLRLSITAIQSTSGTVRVSNADNGGNGVNTSALFDYSNTLGADRSLTASEISGARHLKFSDPAGELFTFNAVIRGNFPDPAFAATSAKGASGPRKLKLKLQFIANPVTRSVDMLHVE